MAEQIAEAVLRTVDLGLPEPAPDVLDRLDADGHERHGFCEKCWADAYTRSLDSRREQYVEYLALLDELRQA